jgi:hypothetical protein
MDSEMRISRLPSGLSAALLRKQLLEKSAHWRDFQIILLINRF